MNCIKPFRHPAAEQAVALHRLILERRRVVTGITSGGERPLNHADYAGAYCAIGTSFDEYLELLVRLAASRLFDTRPEVFCEQTVASTWQVSMKAAATAAPLAASVLAMAAHLAPEAIPRACSGADQR